MTFGEEFGRIPVAAKIVAVLVFGACVILMSLLLNGQHVAWVGTLMGTAAGAIFAGFLLLAGYVYADAKRRGMPAAAWTALSLLIPNGIGFVLYFVLRKPLVHACPHCGSPVANGFAFCPVCGQSQAAAVRP